MNDRGAVSAWDDFLDGLDDPERRAAVVAWLEERPPSIRALVRRFPPGTRFVVPGKPSPAYVMSYGEGETGDATGLFLTDIDPSEDYDEAFASRYFVCVDHLPGGEGGG
jgi:hypothetical protein